MSSGEQSVCIGPREAAAGDTWIPEHPRFREMMALDVADSAQVYAAFLVYMDLLEVRNWHEVQIFGSPELHLIYLRGREKEEQKSQVVIPTPVSVSHSHERIQQIMKVTCTTEDQQNPPISILLAVLESDSTIVYYKLADAFVIPAPPDVVEDVDNKQWRKKRIRLLR
ncbi:tRNA-splicing endonuclease subunit Sen15 [Ascaphus truei]|uniref:tRNA-splicing endonuclease subunit Sen15 n=1 Tax=Ascaphus truei TaxID=8439 RepID=UPI003F59055C